MIIYLIILLLGLILMNLNECKTKKIFKIFYIIFLIFILGFRKVGTDYLLYETIYNQINMISYDRIELGIKFFMYYFSKLNLNFVSITLLFAIITVLNFYRGIKKFDWKNENLVYYAIFVFVTLEFYAKSFNIMKQMVAVSFVFYSLVYLKQEKFSKFLINILIASLFHKTAIIFILAYFVPKTFNNKFLYKLIVIITFFSMIFYKNILNLLIYSSQYSLYSQYDTSIDAGLGTYLTIIMFSFLIFRIYLNRKKIDNDKMVSIVLLSIPFMFLSIFNNLFMRICLYFFTPFVFLIPELLYANKNNKKKSENLLIILLLSFFFLFSVRFWGGIYPYVFIFS